MPSPQLSAGLSLPAGKGLGAVEVVGAHAFVGIDDVELAKHANRRAGIFRPDAPELEAAALADVGVEIGRALLKRLEVERDARRAYEGRDVRGKRRDFVVHVEEQRDGTLGHLLALLSEALHDLEDGRAFVGDGLQLVREPQEALRPLGNVARKALRHYAAEELGYLLLDVVEDVLAVDYVLLRAVVVLRRAGQHLAGAVEELEIGALHEVHFEERLVARDDWREMRAEMERGKMRLLVLRLGDKALDEPAERPDERKKEQSAADREKRVRHGDGRHHVGERLDLTTRHHRRLGHVPAGGMFQDAFKLRTEVIEVKTKPSHPVGEIGFDAFGHRIRYEDRGMRRRALLGIGKCDYGDPDELICCEPGAEVLGASSDHTILDVEDTERDLKGGDIVEFDIKYSTIVYLTNSDNIEKVYI